MTNKGWIGVDLDGTLAFYGGWEGPLHIGEPIPAMVERVQRWLAMGYEVRVFTARMSVSGLEERKQMAAVIRLWTQQHIGRPLEATAEKDYQMIALYDDRAFRVELNTGKVL